MIRSFASVTLVTGALCAFNAIFTASAGAVPVPQSRSEAAPRYLSYNKEIECLSNAIYFEARGESEAGQRAVARVVLNRVKSKFYPDSICGVVYQNDHMKNACQFSFACDGKPDRIKNLKAFEIAEAIAKQVFRCEDTRCGKGPLGRSTHYHADYVSPGWARKLERTGQVGRHIFYYTATM